MEKRQPPVVFWYKVYAGTLGLVYLGILAMGVAFLIFTDELSTQAGEETIALIIYGVLFAGMGLVLMVACLASLVLPPAPWVWVYDLVLICLGMSGCCIVVCIPLLIYWIKPETQEYFGKTKDKKHPGALETSSLDASSGMSSDEPSTRDYTNPYNSDSSK